MENTKTNKNLNVAVKYSGFDTLKEALEAHRAWVFDENDGKRVDLGDANLKGADLNSAYLNGANLKCAYLSGADLSDAILSSADLSGAYLRNADFSDANLSGANLIGAYLSGANLRNADLSRADLSGANLSGAYFSGANLRATNLNGANLKFADLSDAKLSNANLSGAKLEDHLSWERYLSEVVPALCIAGGKSLEEVAAVWDCHSWKNCPMHVAFGVNSIEKIPALYRLEVERFVMFFDQKLIPRPIVE